MARAGRYWRLRFVSCTWRFISCLARRLGRTGAGPCLPGRFLLAAAPTHADRGKGPHSNVVRVGVAIYRAEGALGTDAQEGREPVGESLTPAEAEWRHGLRDGVFCDASDDLFLAVREGLSYPTFAVWNITEKPSVTLKIVRLSSRGRDE